MPYDPSAGPAPRGPDFSPRVYPAKNLMRKRGPLHLLEAVYCDPCKAKAISLAVSSTSFNLYFISRLPALSSLRITGTKCKGSLTSGSGELKLLPLGWKTPQTGEQTKLLIQDRIPNGPRQYGRSFLI